MSQLGNEEREIIDGGLISDAIRKIRNPDQRFAASAVTAANLWPVQWSLMIFFSALFTFIYGAAYLPAQIRVAHFQGRMQAVIVIGLLGLWAFRAIAKSQITKTASSRVVAGIAIFETLFLTGSLIWGSYAPYSRNSVVQAFAGGPPPDVALTARIATDEATIRNVREAISSGATIDVDMRWSAALAILDERFAKAEYAYTSKIAAGDRVDPISQSRIVSTKQSLAAARALAASNDLSYPAVLPLDQETVCEARYPSGTPVISRLCMRRVGARQVAEFTERLRALENTDAAARAKRRAQGFAVTQEPVPDIAPPSELLKRIKDQTFVRNYARASVYNCPMSAGYRGPEGVAACKLREGANLKTADAYLQTLTAARAAQNKILGSVEL